MRRASRADSDLTDAVRRAFAEFLTVPTSIIAGFIVLAAGAYGLDQAEPTWLWPLRTVLRSHLFGSAQATSDLLSTIAAGLITVTSITISLLLVALQQSAGSMTSQVFDQFLRRRITRLHDVVRDAVHLELQRDIALDAACGIEQIETIAWTSISTAQSNPNPGILGIRSLRDLLARWSSDDDGAHDAAPLPIVYRDDTMARLMSAPFCRACCSPSQRLRSRAAGSEAGVRQADCSRRRPGCPRPCAGHVQVAYRLPLRGWGPKTPRGHFLSATISAARL